MVLLLLLLILVPVGAWIWAGRYVPAKRWTVIGVAFGTIVDPFCIGLYATFFASPLGIVTGLFGLVGGLLHGAPGYEVATAVGIVPSGKVVEGMDHLWISIVNAIIWGVIYGVAGWFIDRLVSRRSLNA